ncbi:phosphorylcholine transferase LicD [Limosilactobacillus sp.]|uniref:LicD family protein n=1 Tax=Limosilactobacillus sp. TaxID=2773925 RepID=UPI00345E8867
MQQLTRPQIQQRLLNIMLNFDNFCQRHDLKMYLCAGTLLGAIRHHGFIPWDDDIDVCMDRQSYNKVLEIAKSQRTFNDHYMFTDYHFGNSSYPFIKVVDLETKMDQEYENDMADYLWIDVFPMDGLPSDITAQKKIYKKIGVARQIQMLSFAKPGTGRTMAKRIIKPFFMIFARMYGLSRANRRLDQLAQSYDFRQTGWIGDVMWGDFGRETLTAKEYFKSTKVSFEGHQFYTMACWNKYLTMLYGNDYMAMPPKSKRLDHHLRAWLR